MRADPESPREARGREERGLIFVRDAKLEQARLEALRAYDAAASRCRDALASLAALAADLCDAADAAIVFVDRDGTGDRVVASVGTAVERASLVGSFGALALERSVWIDDARGDARTAALGPVVAGEIGFLAAVPLRAPGGFALGALYVTARDARSLVRRQAVRLERLAEQAMALLDARRTRPERDDRSSSAKPESVRDVAASALEYEIEQRRIAERRLRHVEMHDELTGLPNRTAFLESVEAIVARALAEPIASTELSLLVVDVDHFKHVNDSLGHGYGDELLTAIGRRLRACVGANALLSRLGGDEFGIALHGRRSPERAMNAAHAILDSFRLPVVLGAREIYIGVSIGMTSLEPRHRSAQDVLRDADAALYRAKRTGRNRHEVFSPDLAEHTVARQELDTALRYAISRGEFRLHFQPIVSLVDDSIRGHEALLRWYHPTYGVVPPDRFIPLAEETGYIDDIGRWVLLQACRTAKAFDTSGMGPRMSVNVSAFQMQSGRLVGDVVAALTETGLQAQRLQLEITETAMIGLPKVAIETATRLKELGVRIALDDFGSGYSSIGFLQQFPIDTLKIDRTFVSGRDESIRSPELVRAILALAEKLGLDVTAEGIETPLQARLLRSYGCTHGQGYFFAKPGETAIRTIRAAARRRSPRYRSAAS